MRSAVPNSDPLYQWLDRRVAPSPMSTGYRAGLLAVAIMMVLLPVLYVGLCLGVAWGVYFYATNETVLLGLHQPGVSAYVGVIAAGCIGIVFMVKPLFSRKRSAPARVRITKDTQPEFLQFVNEICARIGAPRPVRVYVDNQVNASASFENGLGGLFSNRLVLTIGLPLAQGLTVTQLGGVVAHEFGHFTQAVAMRLSYVIRNVNGWFNRVIYERDQWDAKLTAWSRRGTLYSRMMTNAAVGFIWLARKILWCLMMSGHAASAYMMREMEYHADHYEREIAGPVQFKETFLRMRLMHVGSQMAQNHLQETWKGGKLVDNVPYLSAHLTDSMPAENVEDIRTTFEADRTVAKWHATHPSDYQRVERAGLGDAEGILLGDQSAGGLFRDWDELAKQVTLVDYKERHRLPVMPETLIPVGSYLEESSARARRNQAMADFFSGLLWEGHFVFPVAAGAEVATAEEAQARLEEVTQSLAGHAASFRGIVGRIEKARTRRARTLVAQSFLKMGLAVKAADFELPDLRPTSLQAGIESCSGEISRLEAELAPWFALAGEKLALSCRVAISRAREGESMSSGLVESIDKLERFLCATASIDALLARYRKSYFVASIYVNNYKAVRNVKNMKSTGAEFEAFAVEFKEAAQQVDAVANAISYPLPNPQNYAHLTAYFRTDNHKTGSAGHYQYMGFMLERFSSLYHVVVQELLEKIRLAGE